MRVRFLIHVLDQNCLTEMDNIPPVQVVIPVFLKGSQRQKKKKRLNKQKEKIMPYVRRCISPYFGYLRAGI